MVDRAAILEQVSAYYSGKIAEHGPVPAGVDWNSLASQELRFAQLLKLPDPNAAFSLNDYGCGYGALCGYLGARGFECDYMGYDISEQMVAKARGLYGKLDRCKFITSSRMDRIADYTVASGLFNVRGNVTDRDWRVYILETLSLLDEGSAGGFAFNCLTIHSDRERMRPDLYYADPCELFDHCRRKFSRSIALLHDYGLYEFTILVRK